MVCTYRLKDGGVKFQRHVVLVEPQIHWNTGNIGRTCLGVNAYLHLIEPLGFSLESKQVKRAGLDYWPHLNLSVWPSFSAFLRKMKVKPTELALLTKKGKKPFWALPSPERLFLVFGSETSGLPEKILSGFNAATYYIPITSQIRCLNLSTAVGIVLYESVRSWALSSPPINESN
ncbi:MAG: tRNA (cytidine(34)-2'-O)-methyltransferase [Desulfobacterales bacterium]|nr:tRNA (cytidine(34)-2'-O)-methyltransferase [Desulfobacterales bacterium]